MKYNEQQQIRRDKLEKLKELVDNYSYDYKNPKSDSLQLKEKYNSLTKEELEENKVLTSIRGRIHNMRLQGKGGFLNVWDETGEIQVYLRKDELSEKQWEVVELLDLGDIVYFAGHLMKTKTGELTLRSNDLLFITKSISPLPEKYHGLQSTEEIYRRRYLDLITNKESQERFILRSKIIKEIRNYFDNRDFLEFETPTLHSILGGASAKPFVTHHNALGEDFYLRIAPELFLKRLIVGGLNKVYEIGKSFRNEGISIKHNPEFTSIEIYEAYSDVNDALNTTQNLINHLAKEILKTENIKYGEYDISLELPFAKKEMKELVKEYANIDFDTIDFEQSKELAKKHNIDIPKHYTSKGYVLNAFFEEMVEDKLIQPTFVTGYPVEVSPLSKMRPGSKDITDRFELFIGGREYANGFSELNDPEEQYDRFLDQLKEKELGNDESSEMDIDYIEALQFGLPPTSGLGIGIDRLIMLLTNSASIRDILLFPTLKTKKA